MNRKLTPPGEKKKVKVRLDHRTIVLLSDMSVFRIWKERYPGARIIR